MCCKAGFVRVIVVQGVYYLKIDSKSRFGLQIIGARILVSLALCYIFSSKSSLKRVRDTRKGQLKAK